MQGHRHGLGQRRMVIGNTVGDRKGQGFLHQHPFGIGAGGLGGQASQMRHSVIAPHGHGHNALARLPAAMGLRAVVRDLAHKLVPQHHMLMAAHDVRVTDPLGGLRQFIRVMTGMQIRPADAATQHIQKYLSLSRFRLGHILDRKVTVVANNRFHGFSLWQAGLIGMLIVSRNRHGETGRMEPNGAAFIEASAWKVA